MYLDLLFHSRRPTMVIMEVPTIDCASLHGFLEDDVPSCLVLDCRSFLSFNSSHIAGSSNVRFSTIVRRRARGGLGLEHIVPNEDTRCRLLSGDYQSVVLLDDRSMDLSQAKKDGTLMVAVTALCRDPCGVRVFILKGGFDAFSTEYPEMCTKPTPPQGLSLPLSSSHPESAGPGCSPCNTPLYDQGGPVEILPFLYLGSAYHASRKDMLDMLGITALINVSANCPNHFEDSYQYKSIPVEDNHKADISSWFNEAIEFIDSIRNKGGRVFVHCQAGISRSATICLAYLMRTNRVKLDEAFEFVKQRRSIISPNFSFMGQLLQFESQVLATSSCSTEAGSPALGNTSTVFNFPVSIPVHSSAGQRSFLHSPITTSPSC
ncbi:dual specificity protein phosphatase 1 [Boleophthalmus pectinirostris]|uniref:dual specificity protein phosphatase 1 n=1 Tax=Boleophthalmus pectinirostris TaxID=150288 RepID=UPI000A1C5BFE|nr:dual specificity protein phosphatase 1 [Boleophthalmus pectinirostris]